MNKSHRFITMLIGGLFLFVVRAEAEVHAALLSLTPMPSQAAQEAQGKEFPMGFNDNKFYPLGFSPDGKFAYVLGYVDGGCGSCPRIVLFDPVNDQELDSLFFEQEGVQLDDDSLTSAMNGWRVEFDDDMPLHGFPAKIRGEHVDVEFSNGKLWLTTGKRGTKKVADFNYLKSELSWLPYSMLHVEGFFLSPFENRVVIVVSALLRGFEGEVGPYYFVTGAHLRIGFTQ